MKKELIICVILFFVIFPIMLRANKIYSTRVDVELSGQLKHIKYQNPSGDPEPGEEWIQYYALILDEPIDVSADELFGGPELNLKEIQIAPKGDEAFKALLKNLNKRARVKGDLYHSHTMHHHTKILISSDEIIPDKIKYDIYSLAIASIALIMLLSLTLLWFRFFKKIT